MSGSRPPSLWTKLGGAQGEHGPGCGAGHRVGEVFAVRLSRGAKGAQVLFCGVAGHGSLERLPRLSHARAAGVCAGRIRAGWHRLEHGTGLRGVCGAETRT
jgi:hypothetical protein